MHRHDIRKRVKKFKDYRETGRTGKEEMILHGRTEERSQ